MMAAVATLLGNSGKEVKVGPEILGCSDLPQDQFSPSQEQQKKLATTPTIVVAEATSNGSPEGFFSPVNVSDDVSTTPRDRDDSLSSKENSPTNVQVAETETNDDRLNNKSTITSSPSPIKVNLETEYEEEFVQKTDLDLSIIGERVEHPAAANHATADDDDDEAVLDCSSSKHFIRIIHNDREVTLVMPNEATSDIGSTLEFSETLSTSLGITDEIVGLKTTALVTDDNDTSFKHHGDIVIPFSALASGQLSEMIKSSKGVEGIPSFNLVTSNLDSYLKSHQVATVQSSDEVSYSSESSTSTALTAAESSLYTEAFVKLMEQSDEFDPFEKNVLLRFGLDMAEQGNLLFCAAFRVAVYANDMSYFVQGLKAIAKMLLATEALSPTDDDKQEKDGNDSTESTNMTIFGLTDFIISADELFDANDLSAQQYATLLAAIFSEHPSVQSLFDLYHNPDFLLAVDSDEDLRESLCLRDLLHLGKKLDPLMPKPQHEHGNLLKWALNTGNFATTPVEHDNLLKWALNTGLHNFATTLETELPREFINIVYHMFSSGDGLVLGACQKMVDTDDTEAVEEMLLREYGIYDSNKLFRAEMESGNISIQPLKSSSSSNSVVESALCKASDDIAMDDGKDFPDCLLTAVACLVDQQELSEDAAAALLASYSQGNELVVDIYDHFIEFGGVDDFLSMLKVVAQTIDMQFETTRSSAKSVSVSSCDDVANEDENAFKSVMDAMKRDNMFGKLEMAALRLAAAKRDEQLCWALKEFRDGELGESLFKTTLLHVCERMITELDEELAAEL